jgi:single-stranded-DNA-specific exonuclease
MTVNDNGLVFDAIAFRQGHWAEQMPARVDLLFAFEKNVFKGNVSLQLNVRDMKTAGEPD